MENTMVDIIFILAYGLATFFLLATTGILLAVIYSLVESAFKGIVNAMMKEYTIIYYNSPQNAYVGLQSRLFAVSKSDAVRRFRINHGYRFEISEVEKC